MINPDVPIAEVPKEPDFERLHTELETFELMILGYIGSIVRAASQIPDDKWNWSFSERTPTAREICEHTFVWLWCDRQQMTVLDRNHHRPTPELPTEREQMIKLLESERSEWRKLIRLMSADQLDEERETWDGDMRLMRSFLFHIGQHIISKVGQIYMLFFELGLDGGEPYKAPHPNKYYEFTDSKPWPAPRP
ncbi:MAG: DinB family protein [Armatimonadota bacterium]